MAMATAILSRIDLDGVTPEQIGRCTKVIFQPYNYYKVASETRPGLFHFVTYTIHYGFQCTCEAGQHGFVNCKLGVCKHVVWALAAAREEKQAMAELSFANAQAENKPFLLINGKPATDKEYIHVMNAPAKPASTVRGTLSSNRGFSFMR